MIQLKKTFSLLTGMVVLLCACNKDEQVVAPTIDNEALTTTILQLVNTTDATDTPTAQWEKLTDNNGNPLPADVSQATLTLKANAAYTAKIIIQDKTQNPVLDVSDEIKARGNYHLFFYQPLPTTQSLVIPNNPANADDQYPEPIPTPVPAGPALNLTVTITDHDTNAQHYPIGLETTFVTGAASNGWLRIVLRHQPNVKDGTFAPGSTDLDVGFTIKIN